MARFDFPPDELEQYAPPRVEPADYDAFWAGTLAEARAFDLNPCFEPANFALRTVDAFDVTYSGYGGQRIRAWLILPRGVDRPLPCFVEYVGYGGGRATPLDHLDWASLGFALLVMDTRGQGSGWSPGDTPDVEPDGSNPQYPGFMTRGVLDPHMYYYRRVFTDAVRAVECALSHPDVDATRVGVLGGSQGGGITLAVAGLSPLLLDDVVRAAMPDVPFMCHMRRATEITDEDPYQEIVRYCKVHRDKVERVFETLSYFDGVNFATRATAPAIFSVGLMDEICPPSTVYAAFNHYAGPREMRVWPYNRHEGGQTAHTLEQIQWLRRLGWIDD